MYTGESGSESGNGVGVPLPGDFFRDLEGNKVTSQ